MNYELKKIFITLLALVSTFATTALGQNNGTVNYIDAEGNTAQCTDYTVVDSNYTFGDDNGVATLGVDDDTERWYVVADTINLDKALRVEGNAHIILCDDALLNINAATNDFAFYGTGSSLDIYGQAQGTGTLHVYNTISAISASNGNHITINGGTIDAIGSGAALNAGFIITEGGALTINRGSVNASAYFCGIYVREASLTINGGTVNATCTGGSLGGAIGILDNSTSAINGGIVRTICPGNEYGTARGIIVNENSTLTLSLTNASDSITTHEYYVENNSTLRIADGKPLNNGTEELEPGVVSDLTKVNGKTLTPFILAEDEVVLTALHTTWEHTKTYVLNSDVTINERITVSGSVRLVLGKGCTLHAPKGIELSAGNKLIIDGRGTLNIDGCDYHKSGIGAYEVGTLVINNGTINATGAMNGAGLGGDRHNCSGGSITINNGVVNATGGWGAAGIGGGLNDWPGSYGQCGTITINGGQVTATGGGEAYGIGPGRTSENNPNQSGTVVLGWTRLTDFIYATGEAGSYNPQIESLSFAEGKMFVLDGTETEATLSNIEGQKIVPSKYGLIYDLTGDDKPTIADVTLLVNKMSREDVYKSLTPTSSGDVVLTASHTTWENGKTYLLNSDVTIGERITVNGTVRLVLGTGCTLNAPKGIELSAGKKLTIDGRGTLNINNCETNKAGIGACDVGTLIINGGTLNVTGGPRGAGLGGDISNISGGVITINGGVVNATGGGLAAGIGGGYKDFLQTDDRGVCGTITINGGQVTAMGGSGGYGIGPGTSYTRWDTSKSGIVVLGWTLGTDFIHAIGGGSLGTGISGRIENFSFAEGKTFLFDETGVEANSSVEFYTWEIHIGNNANPKIVPDFPNIGLRGDMNGDGKLSPEDVPLMVDAVLYITDEPVPVSSITLSVTEMTLDAYGIEAPLGFYLAANILPRNATNKELEWTTSDSGIARVEVLDGGKSVWVASSSAGECIITATAKDGSGVSASCHVTVVVGRDPIDDIIDED